MRRELLGGIKGRSGEVQGELGEMVLEAHAAEQVVKATVAMAKVEPGVAMVEVAEGSVDYGIPMARGALAEVVVATEEAGNEAVNLEVGEGRGQQAGLEEKEAAAEVQEGRTRK